VTTRSLSGRLQHVVKGKVIAPGDAEYDSARQVWNAMIDRRPAAIVRCSDAADVQQAIAFAREQRLDVSIRGGGHNIAGTAVADGGLMIDLGAMRGVWVDAKNRVANVQPGCLLGDVDRETQLHGLAALMGRVAERLSPEPAVLLLADADLAETAGRLGRLLDPVLGGDADLAIADLESYLRLRSRRFASYDQDDMASEVFKRIESLRDRQATAPPR